MLGKRSPQRELFQPDNSLLDHVGSGSIHGFSAKEEVCDQEAMERTASDIRWKVAWGVELEDKLCAKSSHHHYAGHREGMRSHTQAREGRVLSKAIPETGERRAHVCKAPEIRTPASEVPRSAGDGDAGCNDRDGRKPGLSGLVSSSGALGGDDTRCVAQDSAVGADAGARPSEESELAVFSA